MLAFPPGTYTALVTPLSADSQSVDFDAYDRLVAHQIENKITGIIPCGTTGESPTLSEAEKRELVRRSVAQAKGKSQVVVGSGSNNTKHTIESSIAAMEAGADGVMLVTPYYSKPSQEGLFQHVSAVAKAVPAPIMLYNVPGRSVTELAVETVLRILDACPNVQGIKDASGNVLYCQDLLQKAQGRIQLFSGDDPLTLPLMSVGAVGVVSVTSNLYPRAVSEVVLDALAGRYADAERKHRRLYPIHRALFMEPSPQPTKAALALKGRINASVRLPLVEASAECRARLSELMAAFEAA